MLLEILNKKKNAKVFFREIIDSFQNAKVFFIPNKTTLDSIFLIWSNNSFEIVNIGNSE